MRLIDKDALVAEIKKQMKIELGYGYTTEQRVVADAGKDLALRNLLFFLDTLEVKEVDLCKEEERIWKDFNMGECHLSKNDLENIAKHFFELGIAVNNKAQKGE